MSNKIVSRVREAAQGSDSELRRLVHKHQAPLINTQSRAKGHQKVTRQL